MADVLVIGGGPGGISAALWCRRLQLDPLLLEASARLGGQLLHLTQPIADFAGLPVLNGPQLALRQHRHLAAVGADVRAASPVTRLELTGGGVAVATPSGTVTAAYGVLALGARPRPLNVPGEEDLTHPASHRTDKRWHRAFRGRRVAVVGGGDSAFTDALSLAEEGARVLLIHRRRRFSARANWVEQARTHKAIQILPDTSLVSIQSLEASSFAHHCVDQADPADAAGSGWARTWRPELAQPPEPVMAAASDGSYGLQLDGPGGERERVVSACFIRIGVSPQTGSLTLPAEVLRHDDGRIKVSEGGQTAVPSLFAVGDCCTPVLYASIATAVGQGMRAAKRILALEAHPS